MDIKKSLLGAGWDEKSIDEAYAQSDAPSSARSQENEDMSEGFYPPPSHKRAVKRFVVLCVGAGVVALFIYVFTR